MILSLSPFPLKSLCGNLGLKRSVNSVVDEVQHISQLFLACLISDLCSKNKWWRLYIWLTCGNVMFHVSFEINLSGIRSEATNLLRI